MTTKLILIDTDTQVVVPREPTFDMLYAANNPPPKSLDASYIQMICAAPQLTTPPVLRWEGCELFVGNRSLADISISHDKTKWHFYISNRIESGEFLSENEARRAAEKALGLPIVEEV